MKRFNCLQSLRLWSILGILIIILLYFGNSVNAEDTITIKNKAYATVGDYQRDEAFQQSHDRCGTPPPTHEELLATKASSDCSLLHSQNLGDYYSTEAYHLPVWVHIITNDDGTIGNISDAMVESQIEILNEDFRALENTPGANGTDVKVQFYLAGIDRTASTEWFEYCYYNNCNSSEGINTNEAYKNSLNKDPNHYLNIYTKTWLDSPGLLGYATWPMDDAGHSRDGVVINWLNFGRNSPSGPPYDQGRTTTHEIGHYLGLLHTFQDGCGSETAPGCYSDGDLICDTNPEAAANYGCPDPVTTSCNSLEDPIHNYMDYSDDTCLEEFTVEQAHRIICAIENYRSSLPIIAEEIIGTWSGTDSDGIWYWDVAASQWTQMTASATTGDIAAGDFTGDGKADVASIWSSGLWYQDGDNLAWTKVTGSAPDSLTAGDVTGDGRSEIIGSWSSGIWYWDVAASSWTKMTASAPTGDIAAGDFTGDGKADVASSWSSGLWYQNGVTLSWTKVWDDTPYTVTAGDVTMK